MVRFPSIKVSGVSGLPDRSIKFLELSGSNLIPEVVFLITTFAMAFLSESIL